MESGQRADLRFRPSHHQLAYILTLVNGQKIKFRGLDGLGVLGKAVEKHAA